MMKSANYEYSTYEVSDTITCQGSSKSIERYKKDGYYVKEQRNGYWVLYKPVKVWVVLSCAGTRRTFNMKEDICDLYGISKISNKAYQRFINEINIGTIRFEIDNSTGDYKINR